MSHPVESTMLQRRQLQWPANTPAILRNARLMAPTSSQGLFIDTPEHVQEVLSKIARIPPLQGRAALFIDLEGRTLSRDGTISILQIYAEPLNEVYLLDINALQATAFTTINKSHVSLKNVLEDDKILKAFFDIRNDSDALNFHYGIKLQGVIDVQLMQNVLGHPNDQLRGLGYCISQFTASHSHLLNKDKKKIRTSQSVFTEKEAAVLLELKHRGSSIFKSDAIIGASFDQRPLRKDLLLYSIHDVAMLPKLYHDFAASLTPNQMANVLKGSQHRVSLSQMPEFQPDKGNKIMGPWNSKSQDKPKLFWDFSDRERKEGLHRRNWGKQQEADRKAEDEARKPPRIPTGNTPEAWKDDRVDLSTRSYIAGWTPESERAARVAAAPWQQDPVSPSPVSMDATKSSFSRLEDLDERYKMQNYAPTYQLPALSPHAPIFQPSQTGFLNSSFDQSMLSPLPTVFTPDQPSPAAFTTIARRPSAFNGIADVFAEEAERTTFTSVYESPGPTRLLPSILASAPVQQDNSSTSLMSAQERNGYSGAHTPSCGPLNAARIELDAPEAMPQRNPSAVADGP